MEDKSKMADGGSVILDVLYSLDVVISTVVKSQRDQSLNLHKLDYEE